jgi:N-acetylmuramoyl-L-alanine amidase
MSLTTPSPSDDSLVAIAIWREARGASRESRLGVLSVLRNRLQAGWLGANTMAEVILKKYQFSSFNWNDPNSSQWPRPGAAADWEAWLDICSLVALAPPDNTSGANSYHNASMNPPPKWADPAKITLRTESFLFYKL